MNPIHFSDLFDGDIASGVDDLAKAIKAMREETEASLTAVKEKAQAVGNALRGMSSATSEGQQSTKKNAVAANELAAAYEKLTAEEKEIMTIARQLANVEKDKTTLDKMQVRMASEQETSYNRLSATYSAMKVAINAMTEEERRNDEVGGKLVERSRQIYEQMNKMQQATGKYQLQVGNYTKAMGGLNLSMAQVVREVPTLGNSLNQFAVAISNNVPILMDNISRYSEANRIAKARLEELMKTMSKTEAMKAMGAEAGNLTSIWGALGKSLLSLNTIIVGATLAFEIIAKAIDKKRRAQKEANAETKDAITYEGLLAKAHTESEKEIAKNISKLQTLYSISRDNNRSLDERHKAAEVLKRDYKESFENFSAEEIALGKAKNAYDELTNSLTQQAKARAYLNKITSLQEQMIDQQVIRDEAKAAKDAADADVVRAQARLDNYDAWVKTNKVVGAGGEAYASLSRSLDEAKKKAEDAQAAFMKADKPLQDMDNAIRNLSENIPTVGLESEKSSERVEKSTEKEKSYYWDLMESRIRANKEGMEQEIALSDLSYNKQIANYSKERKLLEGKPEEQAYIDEIITNLINEAEIKRYEIREKYAQKESELLEKQTKEEQKAAQARVSSEYEKLLAENAKKLVASRAKINKSLEESDNGAARLEAKTYKALMTEKLTLERKFQEDLLKIRLENGEITQEQYDIEFQKVEQAFDKAIDKMNKKKGKKFDIMSYIFGDLSIDEYGNAVQAMNQEQQTAATSVKSAFSKSIEFMNEWIEKRIEMAEVAIEAAQKEAEAAKEALDYELEARANGYANNVELTRKQYDEAIAAEEEATAEKARLEKIQEGINTAKQTSELLTATAVILAVWAFLGPLAQAAAAASIAAMWATFIGAKATASQLTAQTYGEGGMEYINYGGSHASGNDVDFGRTKDGRPRRIERGEVVGVINKRNVDKFGVGKIEDVINSLNNGTFADKYERANATMSGFAMGLVGGGTDVSSLERDVKAIRSQGDEARFVDARGNMVVRYKNLTKVIKS